MPGGAWCLIFKAQENRDKEVYRKLGRMLQWLSLSHGWDKADGKLCKMHLYKCTIQILGYVAAVCEGVFFSNKTNLGTKRKR